MTYLPSSIMASEPEIQITAGSRQLLGQLLADHAPVSSCRTVEFLVRELLRADVVGDDEAPGDVVTMGSRVSYQKEGNATSKIVTLVYPHELHLYADALSILTPLGAALLGLSEGQAISYPLPQGGMKTITLTAIFLQPEAARRIQSSSIDA